MRETEAGGRIYSADLFVFKGSVWMENIYGAVFGIVSVPLSDTFPTTERACVGVVVPIPTLPDEGNVFVACAPAICAISINTEPQNRLRLTFSFTMPILLILPTFFD